MKKHLLMIALLVVGFTAVAAPHIPSDIGKPYRFGEPFIFVERNVEFAVFPDGQFDFYYNPRGFKMNRYVPHLNISYNAGYNYNPYIQYDDFGAVIQIENVPVYYDIYGRIVQAGNILIDYNHFGRISRIGGLNVHYNPYNQYTHYSGYINRYNNRFVSRPWHQFYRQPMVQHVIVYHQPYRTYYHPTRVAYGYHKNYYKKNYNNGYVRSYYRPGDNVVTYHRGRRTEDVRVERDNRDDYSSGYSNSVPEARSNVNSVRDRQPKAQTEINKPRANTEVRRTQSESSVQVRDARAVNRTSTNTPAVRSVERTRNEPQRVQTPAPAVKRTETVTRSSGTPTTGSTNSSTSRSTRGRE